MKNVISLKTERMVLLAMMEHPRIMRHALPKLYPALFGHEKTREIFDRIVILIGHGKPIPSPIVMANDPGISKGAAALLASRDALNDIKNFDIKDSNSLIETLEYYHSLRILYENSKDQAKLLEESKTLEDLEEIKSAAIRAFQRITNDSSNDNTLTIGSDGNITTDYIISNLRRTRKKVLPTGFREIDQKINGWKLTDLVIIAARRGQGKSMFTKTLGLKHFYDKRNVITINLEMCDWGYLLRLFSEESGLSHEKLRMGTKNRKRIDKVVATKKRMDGYGALYGCRWTLKTICNPNYTIEQLHRELKYQNYQVCIIDYVNLLGGEQKELWQKLYYIAQYAKLMAKDLNMLIYLIAQLNDEGRVKYGRGLEEASDVLIYWNNIRKEEEEEDKDSISSKKKSSKNQQHKKEKLPKKLPNGVIPVRMKHGKARDYEPFEFILGFDGKTTRFVSIEEIKEIEKMKKDEEKNKSKKDRKRRN